MLEMKGQMSRENDKHYLPTEKTGANDAISSFFEDKNANEKELIFQLLFLAYPSQAMWLNRWCSGEKEPLSQHACQPSLQHLSWPRKKQTSNCLTHLILLRGTFLLC